jgi:hypothetical protein
MIRHSGSERNAEMVDWSDEYRSADNTEFFAAALAAARDGSEAGSLGAIVLLGQRDLPGVALRRAQSVLRWDLRPSYWSHVMVIVGEGDDVAAVPTREVTIHSRSGVLAEPANNAVVPAHLGLFTDPERDANVALITVGMSSGEAKSVVSRAVDEPNLDRLRYDLWDTLGVWQAYLWSRQIPVSPLREGYPMFSSAFVEYCYEAIRIDLSPGASERNGSPEHLWNTAMWWHEQLAELTPPRPIRGWFCIRDPGCAVLGRSSLDEPAHRGSP